MKVKALKKKAVFLRINRFTIFFLFMLPLVIGVVTLACYQSTYTVFPADDISNRISALTDNIWSGNSKIKEFSYDEDSMSIKYILKEGAPSPLVFVTMKLGSTEYPLDLSRFDSVSIKIREATSKRVTLFIKTYVHGVSLLEFQDPQTFRHNQYTLQLAPGSHLYKIKLRDFTTRTWWFERMKVNPALLPKESYQKVITFDLQFNQEGSDYKINKPERIVIENIAFHRAPSIWNGVVIGLMLFYGIGMGWLLIRKKRREKRKSVLQHKSLKLQSYRETELQQIKEFIEANYHVANISTQMVAESLGIPSARVFELLKEESNLTFKQLINRMRIDEAKRLLKETDLRVTEIALNLGFNNVSYFNNLFKTFENVTPSEYREGESE